MSDQFSFDVFLSHHSGDKPRVRLLAERLRAVGLRIWFDEWTIRAGDDIYLAIEQGLDTTRVQVLCLSPAALGSGWVTLERSTVLFRDPTNVGRRFIPLLLSDCHLPDTLRRYKYIDFRRETGTAFDELLLACGSNSQSIAPRLEHVGRRGRFRALFSPKAPRDDVDGQVPLGHRDEPPTGLRIRRVLRRHGRVITRIEWAPDGLLLASAGQDGLIRIWDSKAELPLQVLGLHLPDESRSNSAHMVPPTPDRGAGIAWSPAWARDGKYIACGYGDAKIRIWDVTSGQESASLEGHARKVNNVAWSPDGTMLASSADDDTIRLWDVESRACRAILRGHAAGINTVSWHPEGRLLASASLDGSIRVWDVQSQESILTLRGHDDIAITVTWSPDGRTLASSSGDRTIRIWDGATGALKNRLEGHRGAVSCIAYSFDGRLLASKGIYPDSSVLLWRTDTWETVASLREPSVTMWFAGLAFHPRRWQLASLTDEDTAIRIWDVDADALLSVTDKSDSVRYSSAKVVLVGESGAGKTTLAHRLISDRYVKTDSTHGMNVWRLELPLVDDTEVDREVLLWDLAGQEDYRLIHQLFLEETALALIVINPQKDDPFVEAGDWLKALQTAARARQAPLATALLIPTRLDVGGLKVSQDRIDRFMSDHGVATCLPTSAKRGDNCSDSASGHRPSALKRLIAAHISWNTLPCTSTPRLLATIKNAVIAMRDDDDIRLLRFSELWQRLQHTLPSETFGPSDVRTAVTLLANHGLIRQLTFGDLVLLRPDLLNGYAAAIIRAARAHTDEIGCVAEADIYRDNFDFTGVDRLTHRPDEQLLLTALVQTLLDHSLCIRESDGGEWLLVFPSQYRRERQLPGHPAILVSYYASGELQTIYTTLVVRLWNSRIFRQKELWRNAAEFSTSRGQTAGFVFEKIGEGRGKVSVFFDTGVPDELKVVFIEFVHRHLEKYGEGVHRERHYVCPNARCRRPLKDTELVNELLSQGELTIVCQKCRTEIDLVDHVEQHLGSSLATGKAAEMNRRASRELHAQAREQILTGHMQAVCNDANQIFREFAGLNGGLGGEVEFRDNGGEPSGERVFVHFAGSDCRLCRRRSDGKLVLRVDNPELVTMWSRQSADVYVVARRTRRAGNGAIRWMNITRYLKTSHRPRTHILFDGQPVDAAAIWRLRDEFLPGPLRRGSSD